MLLKGYYISRYCYEGRACISSWYCGTRYCIYRSMVRWLNLLIVIAFIYPIMSYVNVCIIIPGICKISLTDYIVSYTTADEMVNKWNAGSILAIDVGSNSESDFTNYGDWLSGFDLLLRSTRPFKYFFSSEIKVYYYVKDIDIILQRTKFEKNKFPWKLILRRNLKALQ